MLNLYWKIFLAFWLTTLLMVGTAFWLSSYVPVNKNFEPGPPPRVLAREARVFLRHNNLGGFQLWAAQMKTAHNVEFFLLDDKNQLISDKESSPFSAQQWPLLIEEMRQARRHGIVRSGRRYFVNRMRHSHNENSTRFAETVVISTPSASGEFARLFIRNSGIRFGIAVIISGLICYWLARYFTVPIRRMRAAMKKVADGDYSVRITQDSASSNDELRLLADDFDRMTEKVQQTLSSQARLIKDVSHELRSPLARLQVSLGLAQQKIASAERNRAGSADAASIDAQLQRIDDEVHVIDELVEQILSLPQRDIVLTDAVDLLGVVQHCIDDAKQAGAKARIDFNTELDEAVVATSGRLLLSVFSNIISNALRYTAKNTAVIIDLTRTNKAFIVTVSDAGPGVDPAHLAHLFEPFYRASDARERHTGGHGLGLAIAERNVLLHGGTIEASNIEPSGLQIRVELPEKMA